MFYKTSLVAIAAHWSAPSEIEIVFCFDWARGAMDGAESAKVKWTELEHGAQSNKSYFVISLGKWSCMQLY